MGSHFHQPVTNISYVEALRTFDPCFLNACQTSRGRLREPSGEQSLLAHILFFCEQRLIYFICKLQHSGQCSVKMSTFVERCSFSTFSYIIADIGIKLRNHVTSSINILKAQTLLLGNNIML